MENFTQLPFAMEMTPAAKEVIDTLFKAGFHPYVVGGSVRDQLLGIDSKDIDIEVYGAENFKQLISTLKTLGHVNMAGKAFGVLKLNISGEEFDVSLPRTESKAGSGHRGFQIQVDPNLPKDRASARRDFTINALMWNPKTQMIEDYHGGISHMEHREIVATSESFGDDPLRVIRGAQFAARFGFTMEEATLIASQNLVKEFDDLSTDRIVVEMRKLLTKGKFPSLGLQTIVDAGWGEKIFGSLGKEENGEFFDELKETLDNIAVARDAHGVYGEDWYYALSVAVIIHYSLYVGEEEILVQNNFASKAINRRAEILSLYIFSNKSFENDREYRFYARELHDEARLTIEDVVYASGLIGIDNSSIVEKAKELEVYDRFEPDFFRVPDLLAVFNGPVPRGAAIRDLVDAARDFQYSR